MRLPRLDDQHPLTGWHILAIVGLFFGTIIAVNVVMAFAAAGTFPGLVVENSYVASQHYDELLAKAGEQEAAGWRDEFGAKDGRLTFALADRHGLRQTGLSVSAHVGRGSTTRQDRNVAFVDEGGLFTATESLAAGLWEVDLAARRDGETIFRKTQKILLKEGKGG